MQRWQLSVKELTRYSVIKDTIEGYLRIDLAAGELHLSTRQIFRLKRRLKEEGIQELIHGNREKPSPRRIPDKLTDTPQLSLAAKI